MSIPSIQNMWMCMCSFENYKKGAEGITITRWWRQHQSLVSTIPEDMILSQKTMEPACKDTTLACVLGFDWVNKTAREKFSDFLVNLGNVCSQGQHMSAHLIIKLIMIPCFASLDDLIFWCQKHGLFHRTFTFSCQSRNIISVNINLFGLSLRKLGRGFWCSSWPQCVCI